MNVFEVLVVVAVLTLLAAILLPALMAANKKASRINCTNDLKQLGLAYRIWAQDNNDLFPMQVSVTNSGAMELAVSGNAVAVFQVMSNELSTPKVLVCPLDLQHSVAADFTSLRATNLSYFVGLDASTNCSGQQLMSGDANLTLRGAPAKSGLLDLATNAAVGWATNRHDGTGNIGVDDGSVQQATRSGFKTFLAGTGLETNHLVIP